MKVILLQDVVKLGRKFDVKEVADGYARNFLIVHELAKPATSSALAQLDRLKKDYLKKAEGDLKISQELASKLDGLEVEIKAKTAEDGTLFGSINTQKIAQTLENLGYQVDKTQIKLESPIKEMGEYDVPLIFKHGLETQIKIIVVKQEEK